MNCTFAAITDLSCLRCISLSFEHFDFGIFFNLSIHIFFKLDVEHWQTAIFRSFQLDLSLGFDLAVVKHKPYFFPSNCFVVFALLFGSLSYWNVYILPNCRCLADWNRFSSTICLYVAPSMLSVMTTSFQFPPD